MVERNPWINPLVEQYKAFTHKEGFKLQIKVNKVPYVNQALYFPTKADSYGYIKNVRKGATPGIYWVRTDDGGDFEFEVLVEEQNADVSPAAEVKEQEMRDAYFSKLLAAQTATDLFPRSQAEPNPHLLPGYDVHQLYRDYRHRLEEYNNSSDHHPEATPLSPDKFDFRPKEFNVGHKVHLNVAARDVVAVSNYLKRHGYSHKYLSGGEIEDGKVFTVYLGSKDLADKLAAELSRDLNPYLKRPVFRDEVEYAPNVIGRFDGGAKLDFNKYGLGIRGINMLRTDVDYIANALIAQPQRGRVKPNEVLPGGLVGAFKRSFERLAKDYGTFFYGTGKKK